MMKVNFVLRHPMLFSITPRLLSRGVSNSSSSSSSSSSDDEKKDANKKKSEEAKRKLELLLTQMIQKDTTITKKASKLELAKPTSRRTKTKDAKVDKNHDPAKEMLGAVKEVAKVVGGDAKQTESELLQKLLNPIKEEPSAIPPNNLSELFKEMKIERGSKPEQTTSRAHQVRQILQSSKMKQHSKPVQGTVPKSFRKRMPDKPVDDQIVEERVPLFGKVGLDIFPSASEVNTWNEHNSNKTWAALEERELKLAVIHPPANYFQQMIQWTEQGKIWRFPIDNEQDMSGEKDLYFTEHVFLEKHIESWCPPKGPLRHFMELVLVGLSKNPYLTVKDKQEHIEWYQNYFDEKKAILKEVEAITPDFEFKKDFLPKLES